MKVGDYVRYQDRISKIVEIDNDTFTKPGFRLDTFAGGMFQSLDLLEKVKSSKNIIDLIEVGDYVNGHTVKMIKEDKSKIDIGEGEDYFWLRNQDIKSIVTKEQFSSMEYIVEVENESNRFIKVNVRKKST